MDLRGQDLRGFDLTGVSLDGVKADQETRVDPAFEPAIRPFRRPAPRPIAFISYAELDDAIFEGRISKFRYGLCDAYAAVIGDELEIFQDHNDISWEKTLDVARAGATFLLPIITPLYFRTPRCREHLRKFMEIEAASQRHDLILPLIWHSASEVPGSRSNEIDALMMELRKRQYRDWHQLLHRDFADPLVRETLEDLARKIGHAFHRSPPGAGTDHPPIRAGGDAARKPLETFRDIDEPWCPELVPLPDGQFVMGSEERYAETPSHLVTIGYRFALGRYPVTFAEYDRFVTAVGAQPPDDEAWGRQRRPVINVSWNEAQRYAAWLSQETGKPYRLLSEAEWEYACRAGTTTRYSWGDDITSALANYDSSGQEKTVPVGLYAANPWGLYDMHGNVWEWVEDRWHDSYAGAPSDGSPWRTGNSERRVLRGGSWEHYPEYLRSTNRSRGIPGNRTSTVGFRVARTLTS